MAVPADPVDGQPGGDPAGAGAARGARAARVLALDVAFGVLTLLAACATPPPAAPPHPLDPLTAQEVRAAAGVLRREGKLSEGSFVPLLVLREPAKGAASRAREATAVVFDRAANATYEGVIDVAGERLVAWAQVPGAQPNVLLEEFESVPEIVRADAGWRRAIGRRGIADFDKVLIDTWASGAGPGPRLARAIAFRRGDADNAYGRPIEGVVAVVDVNEGKVIEVVDTGLRPVSRANEDFDAAALGRPRAGPKPLRISQPRGASFEVRGHEVRWQKWRFRFALHPREGLVLYRVGYEDGGRVRPILHRASISEMVVPYGDPDVNWVWRSAFDEGEYGLGRLANSLAPRLDVPENAAFVDAVMADELGEPAVLERAVALFERDGGVLWTHYAEHRDETDARRGRELVIYSAVTVGNYDYGLGWIFRQDGTLEAEVTASGILLAKGTEAAGCAACVELARGADPSRAPGDERTGTLVARHVVAPNHQHFFCFRLDFDVEGERNSVVEMNVRPLPAGPENPHGNGFGVEETLLKTELGARREAEMREHRMWKVFNPSAPNALGHLAGYMLVPGGTAVPYMAEGAAARRRAGFVDHHVWVTRHREEERYAAGDYPNQSAGGDGLPRWAADDEPLVGEDVVLWYTAGLTHVPRPEEWPVMTAARIGFKLAPSGFFSRNPALDVPR